MGMGGIVACLLVNFLSDYRGRKFAFMIALFAGVVSSIGKYRGI